MFRYIAPACALIICAAPVTLAQNFTSVCASGIVADGYVDFTGLPTAPTVANGGSSTPVIATLPVQGIPGVSVTVTIPALTPLNDGPLYSTQSGLLTFNGNPGSGTIQLEFSKPVFGLSFEGSATDRETSFALSTNPSPGESQLGVPPNYSSTVTHFGLPPLPYSDQLQGSGQIQEAFLTFPNAYSGYPVLGNLRVQSKAGLVTAAVPKDGLQMWLQSPDPVPSIGGLLTAGTWSDVSGNHHDATPGTNAAPQLATGGGGTCQGGYTFAQNQYFNFNLPISGYDAMTIFLVSKTFTNPPAGTYASQAAAILWNETGLWGNTFVSPWQTTAPFRFGTGQVNNQPAVTRPANIGQDFTITRAVHDGATDSLWVNSLELFSQAGKQAVLSGTSGAAFLGRGINNTYFNGEISEVLVYNRVLAANESAAVESYLRNKFGTK